MKVMQSFFRLTSQRNTGGIKEKILMEFRKKKKKLFVCWNGNPASGENVGFRSIRLAIDHILKQIIFYKSIAD